MIEQIQPAAHWYSAGWWTTISAVGQLLAALVAGWAALQARKSAEAAKHAVDIASRSTEVSEQAMRLNERPYVAVMELRTARPFQVDRPPSVVVKLKNLGPTPALKATMKAGVVFVTRDERLTEENIGDLVYVKQQNYLFAPGVEISVGHQLERHFEEEQIRMLEFGLAAIYAWGILDYKEIFGQEHVSKWCFRSMPGSLEQMVLADFHNDMS